MKLIVAPDAFDVRCRQLFRELDALYATRPIDDEALRSTRKILQDFSTNQMIPEFLIAADGRVGVLSEIDHHSTVFDQAMEPTRIVDRP